MSMSAATLTIASDLRELRYVMAFVEEFCRPRHVSAADLSAMHLALEEIITNVITHGYKGESDQSLSITIEAIASDRLRATVSDNAPAFDPLTRPEVDISLPLEARAIGGLGVHLVKKLMDVCSYERRGGKNLFTIERKLNRAPGTPPSMSIAASKLESSATLALTGRLDGLSSPELEQHIRAFIASGIRTLTFDLAPLEYVSSAGLRVFIVAAKAMKAMGGQAHFEALTPNVREVFHVSGLLTALSVQESRDAPPPA